MKRSLIPTLLALVILAVPLTAQDGNISMGVFLTVDLKDTESFERSMREHSEWHADRNDPWSWVVYQAMGGPTEYVVVTGNHQWADFDNPVVDMAADQAEFAGSEAAALLTSEEIRLWETLPEYGNAPAGLMPLVQVTEFEVQGNEEIVLHTMAKFKEATGENGTFTWSRVMSNDGPPGFFVAVFANSFAELGAPGPNPVEIFRTAHGNIETDQILEAFSAVATSAASRIWILRPDLSHIVN